ncbi:type II toxin-antitoxin system HicB family antitoxin [Evansella sp. AB-rgal1]|uniref:type II toxin-antitoxin system HicB family antitoxin n=1 Tax=Evansella sp. AB-rgal1 TaxID=3242696 RepID=UPI00359E804E
MDIIEEKDGYWYGRIFELDGCQTTFDTKEDCLKELEQVKRDYLELKLKHGDPNLFSKTIIMKKLLT